MSHIDRVKVFPARVIDGNPIRGYAKISLFDGSIIINNIKILESRKEEAALVIQMPEYRIGHKKYRPVFIRNETLFHEITDAVITKFQAGDFSPTRQDNSQNK